MKKKFIAKGVGEGKRADTRPATTTYAREERGITLVALVITIIVLLILAGVTIAMVVGDNGILTRAREAKSATEIAEEDEKRELARAEAAMNMENFEYVDENGDKAIIPEGFAPTRIDGENKVEDGLVITDSEGNEFVWIPVKSREDYQKKIGRYNYNITANNGKEDIKDVNEVQQGDNLGINNILGTEIGSWIQQQPEADIVVNASGFYVGRYEAGVEVNEKIDYEKNPEIVVKKNVQPARACPYMTVLDLANNWKSAEGVQSGLITGTQWDVMCNFIGLDITDSDDCGEWANYRTTESSKFNGYYAPKSSLDWIQAHDFIKLGKSDVGEDNIAIFPTGSFLSSNGTSTKQKNIYDIVGNVYEFTTEISMSEEQSINKRGGNAWATNTNINAMARNGEARRWYGTADWADGFRLVLYVKNI